MLGVYVHIHTKYEVSICGRKGVCTDANANDNNYA